MVTRLTWRAVVNTVVFPAVLYLTACSTNTTPPEEQIRKLNSDAEDAAQAKDLGKLKDMIADDYRDEGGYDRRSIVRIAQLYLFRHKNIYLHTLTKSLQVLDEANAVAEVYVAMAGEPIEELERLFDIRAELMRFTVRYSTQDDEWKVSGIEWRRASVDDFL